MGHFWLKIDLTCVSAAPDFDIPFNTCERSQLLKIEAVSSGMHDPGRPFLVNPGQYLSFLVLPQHSSAPAFPIVLASFLEQQRLVFSTWARTFG